MAYDHSKAGCSGIGDTGTTRYDPAKAPVEKNGGNTAEQNGVETDASPQSFYGGGPGSLSKAKGA